jgi:hypothetical protein
MEMTAEKKKFRDPMAFVRGADEDRPATQAPIQDDIYPQKPEGPAVQSAGEAIDAPTPQEKTARRQKAPETKSPFPWDDAHPKVKAQFTLRLPERVHKQLEYLAEHSPDSMHTIAIAGVEAEIRKRLRDLGIGV